MKLRIEEEGNKDKKAVKVDDDDLFEDFNG